jgi:hypothetical protein
LRLLQLKYRITVLLLLAFQWTVSGVRKGTFPPHCCSGAVAGYVMAQEKGYFKEYGLESRLYRESGPACNDKPCPG